MNPTDEMKKATCIIKAEDVSKYYNKGETNEVLAVSNVSAEIRRGDFAVLKGPSGSGKTTLLSLIGCMTRPTSGSIHLEGRDISHLPEKFLTEIRRKTYGFIFQQFHLIKDMNVLENVMIPLYPTDISISDLRDRAESILESLGMSKRKNFPVQGISGGEQQRTAIARALINNPEVILADEPTAHLDTSLSGDLMSIMKDFGLKGKTVIIASHDPLVFEDAGISLLIEMRDGMVKNALRKE